MRSSVMTHAYNLLQNNSASRWGFQLLCGHLGGAQACEWPPSDPPEDCASCRSQQRRKVFQSLQ